MVQHLGHVSREEIKKTILRNRMKQNRQERKQNSRQKERERGRIKATENLFAPYEWKLWSQTCKAERDAV